jgi:hypothetical protein
VVASGAFSVTAANQGSVLGTAFTSVGNLTGQAGDDTFTFVGGSASLTGVIDGGTGSNTIIGNDADNQFNITGSNLGSIDTLLEGGFTRIQNLTGGTGDDTFFFSGAGAGAGSLTGTVNGGAGTDTIQGNEDPNTFHITGSDSGSAAGLVGVFTSIESLDGGDGDDVFSIEGGSLSGVVIGNGGSDTLTYASNGASAVFVSLADSGATPGIGFDGLSATGLTNGFSGIDKVIGSSNAADTINGANLVATWTVQTGDDTYALGSNTLALSSFEVYNGGSDVDTFNVSAVGASESLALNGGAGNDQFTFSNLGAVQGTLTVDGGANTDTLTVDDSANASDGAVYVIDANTFSQNGIIPFSYVSIENFGLSTGTGNSNSVDVESVASGGTLNLALGNANSSFGLGQAAGDLSGVRGTIHLTGVTPTTNVEVHDEFNTTGRTFGVSAVGVSFGSGSLTFDHGPGSLLLSAGSGNDVVTVTKSLSTSFLLNGGGGTNTLNFGATGTDHPDAFVANDGTITYPGFLDVIYSSFANRTATP